MNGFIYISSAFVSLGPPPDAVVRNGVQETSNIVGGCGCVAEGILDNDPHFWSEPPTWGICRPDLRERVDIGDYVFFILGKKSMLPQMIYGYLKVKNEMTHLQAYNSPALLDKRMGDKNPNGNIIVDACGNYNRFDGGKHKTRFSKIKEHYVVGDPKESEFLTEEKIRRLAPGFQSILRIVFQAKGETAIEAINRRGKKMDARQVNTLMEWLRS